MVVRCEHNIYWRTDNFSTPKHLSHHSSCLKMSSPLGRSRAGGPRSAASPAVMTPSSSFFIIHEPDMRAKTVVNSGNDELAGFSPTSSAKSRKKTSTSAIISIQSPLAVPPSPKIGCSARSSQSATQLRPISDDGEDHRIHDPIPESQSCQQTPNQGFMTLSILNRCGSAPDLPLHSSQSTTVYSSSKKRLQRATAVNGSHQVALQRSRLTPLPIDIRTGTLKRSLHDLDGAKETREYKDPLESPTNNENPTILALTEQILENEGVIAAMRQRFAEIERDRAANVGYRNAVDKQNQQLRQENQQLQSDKTAQQRRIEELTQQLQKLHHKLDKLSNRYASVYTGLQKLSEKNPAPSESSVHTVLQTLVRENQELHRKVRVRFHMIVDPCVKADTVEDSRPDAIRCWKLSTLRTNLLHQIMKRS